MFLGHLSFWGCSVSTNLIQNVDTNVLDSPQLSTSMSSTVCELKWLYFSTYNPVLPEQNNFFQLHDKAYGTNEHCFSNKRKIKANTFHTFIWFGSLSRCTFESGSNNSCSSKQALTSLRLCPRDLFQVFLPLLSLLVSSSFLSLALWTVCFHIISKRTKQFWCESILKYDLIQWRIHH